MTQTFSQSTIPFKAWDLDLLVDYVLKFHHRYIRKQGEELAIRLNSLAANHPELDRVVDHFRNSVADLDLHCQKEENILFPYILDIFNAAEYGQEMTPQPLNIYSDRTTAPVTITLAPSAQKKYFKLSHEKLPLEGGSIAVGFKSNDSKTHAAALLVQTRGAEPIIVKLLAQPIDRKSVV